MIVLHGGSMSAEQARRNVGVERLVGGLPRPATSPQRGNYRETAACFAGARRLNGRRKWNAHGQRLGSIVLIFPWDWLAQQSNMPQ